MKKLQIILLSLLIFISASLFFAKFVWAQSFTQNENMQGEIIRIRGEKQTELMGQTRTISEVEVQITKGSYQGEVVLVSQDTSGYQQTKLSVGDKVVVTLVINPQGESNFYITDFIRYDPLIFLVALFVILVIMVAKRKGLSSLIGLVASFFFIFTILLPFISKGYDPVLTAIFTAIIIMPVTFYLSHGYNLKTHLAVTGTLISLVITGILAVIFVNAAHISGYGSEEASFISVAKGGNFNIQGLVLAGIIIGALGILDDITISQAAIVLQIKSVSKKISIKELYTRAISVGHDHIASLVNTLVLVYTGAALPLLILFVDAKQPILELINHEIIAEEIVRTIIASIGLVLAVPITTALACAAVYKKKFSQSEKRQALLEHHH
jgi:uncharacterized membrane protein